MSRRGARPIGDYLRHLLAIVNALSREGAVVDAEGVACLLGITREEAREAIADVQEAAIGADAPTDVLLPLEGDAERGVTLMDGFRPLRALRMTRPEAQALLEVLDVLGVDDEALGGVRPRIAQALFPRGLLQPPTGRHPGPDLAGKLVACLDALYARRGLSFAYEGERGVASRRVVEPLALRYLFDQWVLDALDLTDGMAPDEDEGALLDRRRFFLVGRLEGPEAVALPETHPSLRNLPWDEGSQWVRLYFADRSLFVRDPRWTWSREVPRSHLTAAERRRVGREGCAVDVRHFPGSPYLARLVASCAGACTTDDPALRAEVRAYLDSLPRSD